MSNTDEPRPVEGVVSHELALLRQFYYCWTMAESTRGCYSCCEAHDCRCPKSRGIGDCVCYRDELTKLENEIEALRANEKLRSKP